jgi:hypothetical protein
LTLNNALVAAIEPGGPSGGTVAPERFGALVENACLGQWAVEIKTGRFQPSDLVGLLEFTRRRRAFRPLVVCAPGQQSAAVRAGATAMTWQEFLLGGPSGIKPAAA